MTASHGAKRCRFCYRLADEAQPDHYYGCPGSYDEDGWFAAQFNKGYESASKGVPERYYLFLYPNLERGLFSESYVLGYEYRIRQVSGDEVVRAGALAAPDQRLDWE